MFNRLLILFLWAMIASACLTDEEKPQTLTLDPSSLTLSVGETKEVQIIGGKAPFTVLKNSIIIETRINGAVLTVKATDKTGSAHVTITSSDGGQAGLPVTVSQ